MGSAIATWFASKGVGLVLGFLAGVIGDLFSKWQAAKAQREIGQLKTERDQAREGERVQGDLADEAAKRVDPEDAIAKLERGDA